MKWFPTCTTWFGIAMYFDRFAGRENVLVRRVLRKTIISSNRLRFDEMFTVSSSSKNLEIFDNQCTGVNVYVLVKFVNQKQINFLPYC